MYSLHLRFFASVVQVRLIGLYSNVRNHLEFHIFG